MSKVPQDKQWSALKKFIPPPAKSGGVTPDVFYSDKPAEIILFDGQPVYAQIPDTQLRIRDEHKRCRVCLYADAAILLFDRGPVVSDD